MNYQDEEEKILNEKPYNWKKHFLFDLPEMLFFVIRIFIVFGIAHVVIVSLATTLAEHLPELCKSLNL
jgi:hypothetical protein